MKFDVRQESRIGSRKSNQDRIGFCHTSDALLLVVADGMGGHENGELAAQIAVDVFAESFHRSARPQLPDPYRYLHEGLVAAHQAINAAATAQGLAESPRTTCVACVIQGSIACWAHTGDSRLYIFRGGRALVQTRDHSRVQLMIDNGEIDPIAARRHPLRNRVYSCLGGDVDPQIDFSRKTPLYAGDVVALCSDGVWAPLEDELAALLGRGELSRSVRATLDAAERQCGAQGDNLSLIAIDWQENYDDVLLPAAARRRLARQAGETSGQTVDATALDRAIEAVREQICQNSRQETLP
jgi:serine/threonine protein phosphatase PrpC